MFRRYPPGRFPRLAHLLLVLIPAITGFSFLSTPTWTRIYSIISSDFPEVKHISTETLKAMAEKDEAYYLIDVRDEKEFLVSRIPGAVNIKSTEQTGFPKESTIIVYCSVGYRSARLADQLSKAGFSNVRNLRGSIFEWANKDYPLTDGGKPTSFVHPYNSNWGILLKPELHQKEPD